MKRLKITGYIFSIAAIVTFCTPTILQFICSYIQGYYKAIAFDDSAQTAMLLARKRVWADRSYIIQLWAPTFWYVSLGLLCIAIVCITLYLVKKRKSRELQQLENRPSP